MKVSSDNGITTVRSARSVDETILSLEAMLREKGAKLFALIDHSGEARQAGLNMPPTRLLIFGSPRAGTPLMLTAPSSALDLPLKLLVWDDGNGNVWISYNSPAYLQARHHLPAEMAAPFAVAGELAASLAAS